MTFFRYNVIGKMENFAEDTQVSFNPYPCVLCRPNCHRLWVTSVPQMILYWIWNFAKDAQVSSTKGFQIVFKFRFCFVILKANIIVSKTSLKGNHHKHPAKLILS